MWAAYDGPAGENAAHAHVAVQLVIACDPKNRIAVTADRKVTTGRALIIRPLTRHALEASGRIWSIYLESTSPLGRLFRGGPGVEPVRPVPRELVRLVDGAEGPDAWIERIEVSRDLVAPPLDPRLQMALRGLKSDPGSLRIGQAAEMVGLSAPRLRAIARQELGVPLATWLLWQKLEPAARAIAKGAGLAEAALDGGFADQAHLARTMRRMFGVTPTAAAAALL